jgi:large subunit ribosomal protein L16
MYTWYYSLKNLFLSYDKKKRSNRTKLKSYRLNFGNMGLVLVRPICLNSKRLFRLKLFLKKAARRSDRTQRQVWLNAFPHLPLTRKAMGSRMGKAKGKLSLWYMQLSVGTVLVEFKNLRRGRAFYYIRQLSFKLKGQFKVITKSNILVSLPISSTTKVTYHSFW